MAREKDPNSKTTYIRLSGDLNEYVMEMSKRLSLTKSEVLRRLVKKAKEQNITMV